MARKTRNMDNGRTMAETMELMPAPEDIFVAVTVAAGAVDVAAC